MICGQVDEYLVRAREAFSKTVVLAVGGILSGSGIAKKGQDKQDTVPDDTTPNSGDDLECPLFPPWLGEDGVRCIKAVLQQQVSPFCKQHH